MNMILLLATLIISGAVPTVAGGNATAVNDVLVALQQPRKGESERFELLEPDVNAWATIAIEQKRRMGVQEIKVDFMGENKISGTAKVNMDEIQLEGFSVQLFKTLLSGVQIIEVEGKLEITGRQAVYSVENARFNGISVPAWLVTSVLSRLSKGQPPNIDITEPFNLPLGIRNIEVTPDRLIILR